MNPFAKFASALLGLLALCFLLGCFYVVHEWDQVIITQFGQPIGGTVTDAGLHFKVPFTQTVNRLEKRVLQWDGPTAEMPTKDKLYIIVDTFARWRISDPLLYFTSLRDERSAISRLDDILGSETRNTVARHELVELVRNVKGRMPAHDPTLDQTHGFAPTMLPDIQLGRVKLENEIAEQSREKLAQFGIKLLDIRFKRINYNPDVAHKIHDRMISERRQIAERFRSEGAGEAAKILGTRERDIRRIESEAYRDTQIIQGKADAEATAIYAQAFNQSPEAREFYAFQRTLETYKTAFGTDTTLVLTTGDALLKYLKGDPAEAKPTSARAGAPGAAGTGVPALPPPPTPTAPLKPLALPAPNVPAPQSGQ